MDDMLRSLLFVIRSAKVLRERGTASDLCFRKVITANGRGRIRGET